MKINRIALYFLAVVLLLTTASQVLLFVFEYEIHTSEGGLFGMLEVISKYQALDNIWFAMSSHILTITLFVIVFVFIAKELRQK